ncbi:MAG TPA: GNAT family N-acetyltransferase [Solirubrobacteraceae bacterium]|nr:GNAT family N-acetyltransferase [Solirubrobacteraceae bacterium]
MSDPAARGSAPHSIAPVTAADVDELLDLMRAYCDFYATAPSDESLRALARALLEEPAREGVQLLARDRAGRAVGFATIFWSWDTTEGARIGIMNDLYVVPDARGAGLGERLLGACRERCAQRGAVRLDWLTAPENRAARAVYERAGGVLEPWLVYTLAAAGA